jgi:hypothetical protein
MALIDLYGIGNQSVAWTEINEFPIVTNAEIDIIDFDYIQASADLVFEDSIRTGLEYLLGNFDFDANGFLVGGIINEIGSEIDDGYIVSYIENINITLEEFFATGGDKEALNQLEAKLVSGDDVLRGSPDGGSVKARMLGGNDFVELFGGDDNDVNGNLGADTFELFGGGGRIRGGSEGDTINLYDGFYYVVNGNKGEDILTNYAEFGNNIRGGSDGDLLINRNGLGVFYGDSGSDTFLPFDSGDSYTYMVVKDFEVGIDQIDLSAVGVFEAFFDPGTDSTIFYTVTNDNVSVFASVEGVDIA